MRRQPPAFTPLSLPAVRRRINESVDAIEAGSAGEIALRRVAVRKQLLKLTGDLTALEEVAEAAITAVETIHQEVDSGGQADFTPLTSIDSQIQSHPGRAIVSFLMQEAISQIRAGFGSASIQEPHSRA